MYEEARKAWLKHLIDVEKRVTIMVKRGVVQGITQGIEQGIILGRREERVNAINMIADLVKEGNLTKEIGAHKLNLSEQEFEKYL